MDHTRRERTDGGPDDGLLERVRALAEDRLSPTEADALVLDAAADPEDTALLSAYREVHAVTAVGEAEPPACRVRFEDVEARIEARSDRLLRPWAWRAAAAILVGAVALGAWSLSRSAEAPVVRMTTLRLDAAPPSPDDGAAAALRAAVPLADYVPLRDGEPQWLDSLDVGRAVARATGRPVLLFIHHPTCPMCLDLRGETFQDPDVQARLAEFVPVMVDVMALPESLKGFLGRGWPYLGALDAAGEELAAFPGVSDAPTFRRHLDGALTGSGGDEPVGWGRARALAVRLRDAVAAGERGELVRQHVELTALADDDAGAFGRAAAQQLAVRGHEAAALVRAARAAPEDAPRILDAALARFEGTPWAVDLRSVREALRETGRFPRLEPPPGDEP